MSLDMDESHARSRKLTKSKIIRYEDIKTADDDEDAPVFKGTKFVDDAPPPTRLQRELIFDSLAKIVNAQGRISVRGARDKGDNRGIFLATWGAGYHGQLGMKFGVRGTKKYSAIPITLDMGLVVRQVTCGGLHTAIVTETGRVYTWGDDRKNELGHSNDPSIKQTPQRVGGVLEGVFVTQVACGRQHTACISDHGAVFAWGWSKNGQVGNGDRAHQKVPRKLDSPLARDIVAIACGSNHTLALNKQGKALAWGCGQHGQIAHGTDDDVLEPKVIEALERTRTINLSAGGNHSCFVTENGDLYLAGFGEHFVDKDNQHFFYTPKKVAMPEPAKQVACGQAHNLALSTTGNVYAWGSGEYGQIGHGIRGNTATPRLVLQDKNIAQVAAGRYHSAALTGAGVLYSWGCGENGQLGLDSDENVTLPTVVTPVLGAVVGQVACGELHTAVLTSAPWAKVAPDVLEWLTAEKVELEKKLSYLKQTHRGLTKRDLQKIKEDMQAWQAEYQELKRKQGEKTKDETRQNVASIVMGDAVYEAVLQDERSGVRDNLPPNRGWDEDRNGLVEYKEPEEEDEISSGRAPTAPRFPPVVPPIQLRRSNSTTVALRPKGGAVERFEDQASQTERARTLPSVHGRGHQYAQTARALGPEASRTQSMQFLKDTAGMVKRMTTVVHREGNMHHNATLQKMIRVVFGYRKDYDALRHASRAKAHELADLKKEGMLMERNAETGVQLHVLYSERLERLKMQLNTVNIKILETAENRQNYELNITNLKEEDYDHFNALKELRKALADSNSMLKKMTDVSKGAEEESEAAQMELDEFKRQVDDYRNFVQEQLAHFEDVLHIVRAQNDRREKSKTMRTDRMRHKIEARVERLTKEAGQTEKDSVELTKKLTQLDLKLRHFEDSFQRIAASTGLNDPEEIVKKFFFKAEISDQLQNEIGQKSTRLNQLKEDQSTLQAELDQLREKTKDKSWRDVEHMDVAHREAEGQASKRKVDLERVTQRLAFAQEGMMSLLLDVVRAAEGDAQKLEEAELGELWTPEQTQHFLSLLDRGLDRLLAAEAEAKRQQAEEKAQRERERTLHALVAGQVFGVAAKKKPTAKSGSATPDLQELEELARSGAATPSAVTAVPV